MLVLHCTKEPTTRSHHGNGKSGCPGMSDFGTIEPMSLLLLLLLFVVVAGSRSWCNFVAYRRRRRTSHFLLLIRFHKGLGVLRFLVSVHTSW